MENYKPFKGARRLGYCAGIITESLVYNMYYTYYLFFLTDVAQLKPASLASTISLISVIWDAVTDPIIGYYADRPGSDKRKFMFRAVFPMAITFICAFVPLGDMPVSGKFVFYLAVTMLFWLAYTFYTIPYYAVVADITEDYNERTSIRGTSSLINTLAIAGGNVAPALLPALFVGMGMSVALGWMTTAVTVSAVALLFGVLTVVSLKHVKLGKNEVNKGTSAETEKWTGIFRTFAQIIRLKPFMTFVMFIFFFLAASSMLQSNIVYMIENCIKKPYDDFAPIFIVGLVVTMAIVIPIVTKVAEKTDRRSTCIIFFSISLVGLVVSKIIGLNSVAMFITQPVFMGIASGAFWTLFYSMAYDLVEVDEFSSGKRRESIITAFPQFVQKFGSAIGMWVVGLVLGATGYDAQLTVQSEKTVNAIENLSTVIPAALLAVSILGLVLYPVTRKRMDLLQASLEKKRNGEKYSTDGIEKIVG